ncbi:MAG TPA: hypothetical protein VHY48_14275 [Acidobacteriaceae bacterium]|jgi:hypothetical protein|nr:hypothetical protein [Acidobacteriaceae bacterium]
MRRLLSFALACFMCVCVLIATERRAMAMYVDPGSGLLAIQSAASIAAAAAFFLRRKIRALFGGKPKTDEELNVSGDGDKGDARKAA